MTLQQIRTFQQKMSSTTQALQQKETELGELKSQLNMHSIGMEEAIKAHVQEKERAKQVRQTSCILFRMAF